MSLVTEALNVATAVRTVQDEVPAGVASIAGLCAVSFAVFAWPDRA